MILNHLDLQVHDVQATARWFEHAFGFRHASNRNSPALAFLDGDGGFVLVLQRRKDDTPYPDGFHFGFLVDSVEKVHAARERVASAGVTPSAIQSDARGTRFYCRHADLLVEVSHRSARE